MNKQTNLYIFIYVIYNFNHSYHRNELEMSLYHVIILFSLFIFLLKILNIDICAEYLNVGNFVSIP